MLLQFNSFLNFGFDFLRDICQIFYSNHDRVEKTHILEHKNIQAMYSLSKKTQMFLPAAPKLDPNVQLTPLVYNCGGVRSELGVGVGGG